MSIKYSSGIRFLPRGVSFPRTTSDLLTDPTDNVFQGLPLKSGPHTLLSENGATQYRLSPRNFRTPSKANKFGTTTGVVTKNLV